jgi:ATP-binding cassette subfamily C (CFTR/MRP) protein 1
MVMSFVLEITIQLSTLVTVRARLEASLTSLERVSAYAVNAPEENNDIESQAQADWPTVPTITFESYSVAYHPGGSLCLHDINISVQAYEHIAVIGRTGAGKSSLILAIMRALDQGAVKKGRILVDGVDIANVKLAELRKRIALVPQDPIVFTGTLRENLNPSGDRTDPELLEVMARCSLGKTLGVADGLESLEYLIIDGG